MFAYCGNNPVSRNDEGGEFWNFVIGAVVGATVAAVATAIDAVKEDGWEALESGKTWAKIGVSAACGAVNGLVAASGAYWAVGGFVGGATGLIESAAHQLIDNDGDFKKMDKMELLTDFTVGMIGGAAGGNGAIRGNKYMANQAKSFGKHYAANGLKNAISFYYKMTANYSIQFIGSTLWGITKGFVGGKLADYFYVNTGNLLKEIG